MGSLCQNLIYTLIICVLTILGIVPVKGAENHHLNSLETQDEMNHFTLGKSGRLLGGGDIQPGPEGWVEMRRDWLTLQPLTIRGSLGGFCTFSMEHLCESSMEADQAF